MCEGTILRLCIWHVHSTYADMPGSGACGNEVGDGGLTGLYACVVLSYNGVVILSKPENNLCSRSHMADRGGSWRPSAAYLTEGSKSSWTSA